MDRIRPNPEVTPKPRGLMGDVHQLQVSGSATAEELRDNEDVKEFYLGGAGDQRKSFKKLKSFKRRKRWL